MAQRKVKLRLDELLLKRGLVSSINEAAALIMTGKVLVSENIADKPGRQYLEDVTVRIKRSIPYVSRGGLKLQGGLDHFNINPAGWTCADIGASTGGFTDCLLQRGAALVYAVDVSYGELHWKLRTDDRVVVHERLNVRSITSGHISQPLHLAVFDTSFISLATVIPPVLPLFGDHVRVLALIKPQFELPQERIGKGGIVRDETDRLEAIETIKRFGLAHDLVCRGYSSSIIKGAKGNQEYLIYFERQQTD